MASWPAPGWPCAASRAAIPGAAAATIRFRPPLIDGRAINDPGARTLACIGTIAAPLIPVAGNGAQEGQHGKSMMEQRNLIVAIALSIAILLGFQFFFEQPRVQQAQKTGSAPQATAPAAPGTANLPGTAPGTAPGTVPGVGAPAVPKVPGAGAPPTESRAAALAASPRVRINTASLHGSIALTGGRIDDLALAQYHETVDPKSPEIVLFSPLGTTGSYYAEFGWVPADKGVAVPDSDTQWTANTDVLTSKAPVTLSWDNGAGLRFIRTISVDDEYMFTVKQTVENHSAHDVKLLSFGRIARFGQVPVSSYYILHEGPIGVLDGILHDGSFRDKFSYADLKSGPPQTFTGTGGWLGFTDKYWLATLIPDQQVQTVASMRHAEIDRTDLYQADYAEGEKTVSPGGSAEASGRLFAGPKVVKLLDKYEENLGIKNFSYAVDWGLFWFLTKPMFTALDFFYGVIGNFGIAILLLTVTVKLLFFPLANKSYKAMSKMKLLQPEMLKLREKFGDDKAKLNEEMMALYKRVGANPLAGCLPVVIQIPVFFSLYKVLYVTIEMRHAPFYGWIHDLSSPDPTSFANLFGLIPWSPPHVLMIGAWPLIMGLTMFMQQRLNPQPADPVQAKMFMFLPIVFTYMLASFPAGLVIYWAWNNTLSVLQQWVIMRRAGAT
jgi:YidC/Oxa1 family membrane protein insertase